MPYNHISTVTQNGMTAIQPGTSVSVSCTYGAEFSVLNVSRYYNDQPNQYGGRGAFLHCDCDGSHFYTSDEAFKFAFDRGYLQHYYRRSHPDHALRAAIKTAKSGYKGTRKLTRYLVAKAAEFGDNRHISYDMTWSDLKCSSSM